MRRIAEPPRAATNDAHAGAVEERGWPPRGGDGRSDAMRGTGSQSRSRARKLWAESSWPVRGSVIAVGLLALMALVGPWLAPYDPQAVDLSAAYQTPSAAHLLGTDNSGRDILSWLLTGARISLLAPLVAAAVATAVGTTLALAAALEGRWVDFGASRILDIIFAFPGLLLAILAVAIVGTGLVAPILALAIAYVPYIARIVRGAALRERHLPYVVAAELQGFPRRRVAVHTLLPNIAGVVATQAAVMFGYAMVDLAAINFLGLGLNASTPDWGVMVAAGQPTILRGQPEETLFASLMIVITVVAVNVLSQGALTARVLRVTR